MAITKTEKGWRVDLRPTGSHGLRVRRVFDLKINAEAFERETYREQERLLAGGAAEITVGELLDRFRDQYAKVRMKAFENERYKIKMLHDFYAPDKKKIGLFRLSDGERFVSWRLENGIKVGTINRNINLLKRVFTWAVETELLPYSPLSKLKHLKGSKARCRWLTEAEERLVLDSCLKHDVSLWWPVFVACQTGFRLGNIEALEPNDFKGGLVYAKKTKSGEPYEVPVSQELAQYVHAYADGRLKIGTDLGRRFRRVVKKAGLYTGEGHPDNVTFHTLRHTFASRWLQRGVPIYTVSQWLGHSSVGMTESVYAHLSKKHHIETMRKFAETSFQDGQKVDTLIIPFPQNASVSICPQGESNPCFGLERIETGHEDVTK